MNTTITFSFELPEEESEYLELLRYKSYHSALHTIAYEVIKSKKKYGEYGEEATALLEQIWDEFWETVQSYEIPLE